MSSVVNEGEKPQEAAQEQQEEEQQQQQEQQNAGDDVNDDEVRQLRPKPNDTIHRVCFHAECRR